MKVEELFEAVSIIIIYDGYEYKVPGPDGKEHLDYHTEDEQDALNQAKRMYDVDTIFRIKRAESEISD